MEFILTDFLKKTAVGGAILILVVLLAWKLSFILLGLGVAFVFLGLAHCIGSMCFPDDGDNHGV